ncbi:ABC transporter permease [Brevibacillus fluminis]|uniref:ABC transporter permease n=1 Tax=Brevibacillus fluminis TaxID=511487 RepID=A0A3M8DY34_9BACL|nr:ABC transporter permease [Brevibacillus fluminis]RNB92596.1 ABC transporter permease [Brevibacillus fluminis]RNB92824.1 ABC transporter permease [Brevibacillus fluminis]
MVRFIIRRLLLGLLVLVGVSLITFFIARVIPSEPAARWVGAHATAEQIQAAKIELGLDQPLYVQYATYMKGLVTGDWGKSIRTHQPILDELLTFLPSSLELIFAGMLIAIIVGIPLGVISAVKKESWVDHLSRGFSIGGVSIPTFWLALILQLVFFKTLGWLPLGERVSTDVALLYPIEEKTGSYLLDSLMQGNWDFFTDALLHLILPALAMAAYPIGLVTRMIRSSMVEVMGEEYMRVLQAYGVSRRKRVFLYALKNAMSPTVTSLGLTFAYALTSTFLIEAVFSWPGLGMYASQAILSSDYPAVMGITLLVTISYILVNLLVDILLVLLDPRIKLGETA